jgi:type I restriction enzyme S subunit
MAETLNSKNQQPSVWKNCRVEDFCTTASGGTPLTTRRDYYDDGHIPWLRSGEVSQGRVRHAEISITQPGLDNSSAKLFKKGTILVAMYGATAGEVGILEFESSTNQAVCGITPGPSVDGEFLFQALLLRKPALIKMAGGGAQPNISQEIIRNFKIPLPPLAEQRKIAEILRTWDEAIETAEAELSRLKEQLVSLIAKLTLRQCVGKPEQGWHDVKIGDLLEEVDRDVEWDDGKTFSLISCGRRASGIFLREKKAGSDIDVKKMYEVQAGDFIVSQKQSAHAGWGMVTKEFHGHHVSPMYTIYGLKGKGLHMPFFNWLCKMPWMRHQAYLSSYGVHIEKMSFVSRLFLKTKIRIPTLLPDQEKACAVLESAEAEIKAATLKLEKLNDQKRGLMQKLLTGEVRVAA